VHRRLQNENPQIAALKQQARGALLIPDLEEAERLLNMIKEEQNKSEIYVRNRRGELSRLVMPELANIHRSKRNGC
jgi:hypothetical protein